MAVEYHAGLRAIAETTTSRSCYGQLAVVPVIVASPSVPHDTTQSPTQFVTLQLPSGQLT
jgi:hypothetical protein